MCVCDVLKRFPTTVIRLFSGDRFQLLAFQLLAFQKLKAEKEKNQFSGDQS
jgi:hypothetical protein